MEDITDLGLGTCNAISATSNMASLELEPERQAVIYLPGGQGKEEHLV